MVRLFKVWILISRLASFALFRETVMLYDVGRVFFKGLLVSV